MELDEVEVAGDIEVEFALIEWTRGFDRRRPGWQADRPHDASDRVAFGHQRDVLETPPSQAGQA